VKKLAIFASGTGSNAQKIIDYFNNKGKCAKVEAVISNKPNAGVVFIARKHKIKTYIVDKEELKAGSKVVELLKNENIDYIVLAGFLLLLPSELIKAFPNKIINIHPALLPKYGGYGMYGKRVHEAIKQAGETESGITIHFVNEHYDKGEIIFQAKCTIDPEDSAETIAQKVQMLEHQHLPKTIEQIIISEVPTP
jgi:phosphoribosylglycinamide formyltransferase 1